MAAKDKNKQSGNALLILLSMVMGVLIGLMFGVHGDGRIGGDRLQSKLGEVVDLVQKNYVDAVDVDSIGEVVVRTMLTQLDPHSTYLSARETKQTNELMRGSFEGVGLVLHREGDTTYVGQVLADGPSAKLGIMPGDMIVKVDGELVSGCGMEADSVVARLRGQRGSVVNIEVERVGEREPMKFKVRRGVVPHHTLPYSAMLDDTTGYIVLNSFAATSHDEFRRALGGLKEKGMRHLVFDLRGNGGGSLQSAIGIADELLPANALILYTNGAHVRRQNVRAHAGGLFEEGRVTVMVDENSASASEVVSGALQDNDRATIVGRRTFGKGLVQTEYGLDDGSSLMLTTARYYTPSGRCIQRPYDEGTDQYYRQYFNQLIEETYADSAVVHILDSTPYYTVGGRVVYGGGGIVPDRLLTIKKDSSFIYYNQLMSRGLMSRVAFGYMRQHVKELTERYAGEEAFGKDFRVSNELVEQLVAAGEAVGIACDRESLRRQRALIESMLKAYIGQSLYGDGGFYRSYLQRDDDLQRVIHER